MRTLAVVAIGLLAGAAVAAGQTVRDDATLARSYFASVTRYEAVDLDKLQDNILANLGSENYGVVESALAHAAHLRLARPGIDMSQIREAVVILASEGPTAAIRYKAHLVSQVCRDPARFSTALQASFTSGDEFFANLGSRLQAMM